MKVLVAILIVFCGAAGASAQNNLTPGTRVLLHAHNAYPELGRWADRIERALSTGPPIAIEQDLAWYRDPKTGVGRSVISHGPPLTGEEPSLEEYFFRRVRPLLDEALRNNQRDTWPVITLHLDFKTNEPEHHAAVWETLGRYERWLTTAERTEHVSRIAPLDPGPLLVLTEDPDEQERSFHDNVPVGGTLRLFGSVHTLPGLRPGPRTNYRRWWNHSWAVVEEGGQNRAGDWTPQDEARLMEIAKTAHDAGLWLRFYTLNGHDPADGSGGWTASYNFGSLDAVRQRWTAAIRAGVDFVAVDQYEEFARVLRSHTPIVLRGVLTRADYERQFEHQFEVPAGTTRVDVELTYDDRDKTVIDLGLRGPNGFRGWSGGGAQRIVLADHTASYGYTPGPIEHGSWAVILGVPNIREGVSTAYEVSVTFSRQGEHWPTLMRADRWYAGDLHTHSGHSDGRTQAADGNRLRVPPSHVFDAAEQAGLDFVALTDHNTASHWVDVDRLQPLYPRLLLLHGREVTTYRGHFNAFGERGFVDFRLGPSHTVRDVAAAIRSSGAFVSINHPTAPDDERCMGCGWNDRDADTLKTIDAVEIVNGDTVEGALDGWSWWADLLNQGYRFVAVGGSDDHTPDETTDRRLGRPTTMVHADELSEAGVLAGLRRGRVYVRTRGVDGPSLEFTGRAGTAHASMGDAIAPARELTLQVQTEHAVGQRVSWIRRATSIATTIVDSHGRASFTTEARAGDWFSVVLRDQIGVTVFSNPMWIDGEDGAP